MRIPENFKHLADASLGVRAKGFVSFVDFGPTVLNLAGLTPPAGIDGGRFSAMASDGQRSSSAILRSDTPTDSMRSTIIVRTLRKGRFTYHRNFQPFNFDSLQNDYRYKMLAYREWRELFRAGKLTESSPSSTSRVPPRRSTTSRRIRMR